MDGCQNTNFCNSVFANFLHRVSIVKYMFNVTLAHTFKDIIFLKIKETLFFNFIYASLIFFFASEIQQSENANITDFVSNT